MNTEDTMFKAEKAFTYGKSWLHAIDTMAFIETVMKPQLEPSCKESYGSKKEAKIYWISLFMKLSTYV